jgi:PAS domain S-box-containing protein
MNGRTASPDEEQRLALLYSLAVLDTAPEPSFDGLVELAAQLTGCAIALVSLIDRDRLWFKAAYGIAPRDMARESSICTHAVGRDALLEVADTLADPRLAGNPLVTGGPRIRFYAGVPLRLDGHTLGTLCVMDAAPRRLDAAQRAGLHHLAVAATELLRSRQRLHAIDAERARLLDFAHASGDWMWETDAALRYTWISGAFEPVTGEPPSAMIGRTLADAPLLDTQGDPLPEGATLHDLLRADRPFARALTEKHTPHGRLVISRSAVPVLDADGRLAGWRGTTRDMTERLRAAAAARERELLLTKLSAQLPGALHQFRIGPDGRAGFTFASEGVRELFGIDPQAVIERAEGIYDVVLSEERAAMIASVEASRRALTAWRHEYRVRRPDGSVRWLASHATPERMPDGSTVWHGFTSDVTHSKRIELALRESEERWSLAAEAAGIGVAELDLEAATLRLDERACRNHRLPPAPSGIPFEYWMAQIEPDDRAGVAEALRRALDEGRTLDARYRLCRRDGAARWLEITARGQYEPPTPLRGGPPGHPVRMVGTCRDVTEQHEAEQLRRDKEAAESASRAKSEFLSRMSHELRTPLNSILGFTQLMALDREHALGPDQRKRLDSAQRSSHLLLGLINDVLDLTRIECEDFKLAPRPVDLARMLGACLVLIQPLAREHAVALPAPAGAPWVRADARALEQVLMNLLSNAIKYNRRGGSVRLEVTADGTRVRLAVVDQGPGLDERQQRALFEPFNRLGAERTRVQGTGLGLVIARQLAQAMGGTLEVESRPGAGSRFTLVLDAAEAQAGDTTTPAQIDAGPPSVPAALPQRHVLYIEDEPVNVLLMEEVFRGQAGWTLEVARDGAQGLALARRAPPDVLLIDMNLPDMSGIEVVRALRNDPATAGLRCIALSADAMREQIETARAAGFNDYWTKPIDVRRMIGALADALDK